MSLSKEYFAAEGGKRLFKQKPTVVKIYKTN